VVSLRHRLTSAQPNSPDAARVRPTEWNETHVLSGGTAGQVLQRDTGASDGWSWTTLPDVFGPGVVTLLNATGVALSAGDVVALDPTTDQAVRLGDTASSLDVFVVAAESIAPSVTGRFFRHGLVTVKVQGAVTRGRYLVKSATSRAMGDSGVAMGPTTLAPSAALAVATTAAAGPDAGTVTAYLLADTGRTPPPSVALIAIRTFTSSGTWTKPSELHHIVAVVTGGGGAGGSANAGDDKAGGGGGAGATAMLRIPASSLGATEAVTVGAGGTPVADSTGNTGGTSSFGAFVSAAGGGGGAGRNDYAVGGTGAATPGTGDVTLAGGGGGWGGGRSTAAVQLKYGGLGGASCWGGGARETYQNADGQPGVAYGSGGAGAAAYGSGFPNRLGGAGASGVVVVWEYGTP
jgi:hypothetical protein